MIEAVYFSGVALSLSYIAALFRMLLIERLN